MDSKVGNLHLIAFSSVRPQKNDTTLVGRYAILADPPPLEEESAYPQRQLPVHLLCSVNPQSSGEELWSRS